MSIYSPCAGKVVKVVNDMPDLTPPKTDPANAAGNHIVIVFDDIAVLLAHLKQGSILVNEGDVVEAGQELGRIGNSGNTSEPHLHIHAVKGGSLDGNSGEGVPILFDGKFLVRNDIRKASN